MKRRKESCCEMALYFPNHGSKYYWDEVDADDFSESMIKTRVKCSICGEKGIGMVYSKSADAFEDCRQVAIKIAGIPVRFCVLVVICPRCFDVKYYRPCVDRTLEGLGASKKESQLRIYPPVTVGKEDRRCFHPNLLPPSVIQEEREKRRRKGIE